MTALEIDHEIVEAAAKADYEHYLGRSWAAASDYDQNTWLDRFRDALAAALPHIEAQVRETVARELEAIRDRAWYSSAPEHPGVVVVSRAAVLRIARGGKDGQPDE